MRTSALRILHISDLHARPLADVPNVPEHRKPKLRRDAEQRRLVLGETFLEALDRLKPIDLVVLTGDVADWGLPEEYAVATRSIDDMLRVVGVGRDRFFAVPGNHDVQRQVADAAWKGIRQWLATNGSEERIRSLGQHAFGETPPNGIRARWLPEVKRRTAAFWSWLETFTNRKLLNENALGYRQTIEVGTFTHVSERVHIIGLDSAWLCGADKSHGGLVLRDQGGIVVTEPQVERHLLNGGLALGGYRIVLVHHPLEHLADHLAVLRRLAEGGADILLHGHQHDPRLAFLYEPGVELRVLAAGCLMEGDFGRTWPNGFNVLEVELSSRSGAVHFKKWSKAANWVSGTDLYRNAYDGVVRWAGEESWTPTTPPLAVAAVGNDALVVHQDGALALWRRGAQAAWWTREARPFDLQDPPMHVLESAFQKFRDAAQQFAEGRFSELVSGQPSKEPITERDKEVIRQDWFQRVSEVSIWDVDQDKQLERQAYLGRVVREFPEIVEDVKRWWDWLGQAPSGLDYERWAALGVGLQFRVFRVARGKKVDASEDSKRLAYLVGEDGLSVTEAGSMILNEHFSWSRRGFAISRVAISRNGDVVAVGDWHLSVWNVGTKERLIGVDVNGSISDLAVSPDGKAVAVALNSGGLELWNVPKAIRTGLWRGQAYQSLTWGGLSTIIAASNGGVRWFGTEALARRS